MVTSDLHLGPQDHSAFPVRASWSGLNLRSILFPMGFVLFMCEISRIAQAFIPGIQEAFWMVAYACLFWFAARRPTIYLALARRNLPFLAAAAFAICSGLWVLTPNISAYSGALLFLNVLVGFLFAERL